MKILKQIKNSPFKPLLKKYYLGKLRHGAPYFWPRGYCPTIFKLRKLKLVSDEKKEELDKRYPHLSHINRFENLPMSRRSKDWIFNLFGVYYWLQVGWPVKFYTNELGWKDKFNTPRFEWGPAFYIFFFKWQFCVWWIAPEGARFRDTYWEMFLWWKYYSNENLEEAEKTWKWVDGTTKKSTWDKTFLK